MNTATYTLLAGLTLLAVSTLGASIDILRRGKLYHRIKPESRPRRWVLFFLLALFGVFVVWFPMWLTYPDSTVSKALGILFAVVFGVVGLTLKWFAWAVDAFYERKGWPLR